MPFPLNNPQKKKELTPLARRNSNSVLKALRAKGADPRDEDWIVDVDASDNYRGVRKNASPCMLASRDKGFWVTSRGRRLTLPEASRLQGLEPLTSRLLSNSQLFGLLGNSMTRTVIVEVASSVSIAWRRGLSGRKASGYGLRPSTAPVQCSGRVPLLSNPRA